MDFAEQESADRKRLNAFKEAITDKKRTDSRNEQLAYRRKRAIKPIQIRQLSQEDITMDVVIDEETPELLEDKIREFKLKITKPSSEEDLWKALLIFEAVTHKVSTFNLLQSLAEDAELLQGFYTISQTPSLPDECKIGVLQAFSEVTDSFLKLNGLHSGAENAIFDTFLQKYKFTKTRQTFASVLRGIARLCLDNKKARDYFIAAGFYNNILDSFELLVHECVETNAEILKDACIIIHGLSQSRLPLEYTNPKLGHVIEYLINSQDQDLHYDISSALYNFVKAFASKQVRKCIFHRIITGFSSDSKESTWVKNKLIELYQLGLMKAMRMLIKQPNVWIPVRCCKILTSIAMIKYDGVGVDFTSEMHSKGIFRVLIETLKDSSTMIVLKYHLFMTIRELVERDCVEHLTYPVLLQDLLDPISNPNNQMEILIVDIIWEMLHKDKANMAMKTSENLIKILCDVMQSSSENSSILKALDILDQLMQSSIHECTMKQHSRFLQCYHFNQIAHQLQQSKSLEIQNKAVTVVSYLDSDEDSEDSNNSRDDFSEEEGII